MISSPASGICKELGSCHSHLHNNNKKLLDQLKINNSSYSPQKIVVTGQSAVPQIGKTDRWIQRITIYQSRNPWAETSAGTSIG